MKDRLPPNQKWVSKPVIYDIVRELPETEIVEDFHCVTHWSVKDIRWEGVKTSYLLDLVKPKGDYAMAYCIEGYTTNLPIKYLYEPNSIIAYKMNGEIIPKRHGFPLRLIVPSLYAWKSAKYLYKIEVMRENRKGFWELRGYHDIGDPWQEQRFSEE